MATYFIAQISGPWMDRCEEIKAKFKAGQMDAESAYNGMVDLYHEVYPGVPQPTYEEAARQGDHHVRYQILTGYPLQANMWHHDRAHWYCESAMQRLQAVHPGAEWEIREVPTPQPDIPRGYFG